jgi:ribosomal protein L11 methyltransferase
MPWLALTLEVDSAGAEALSEALLDAGARSVSLDDIDAARVKLQILLDLDADPDAVVREAARIAQLESAPRFQSARLDDQDWVRRSQAQFEPVQVGERLWIGPTWREPPRGMAAVVRLDPGLAFGTGSHPTTRLVLDFLEKNIRGGEHVLDYGCGSGILAIAAAKLGASKVVGVDVDPDALRTAAENAAANGVLLRTAVPEELAPSQFDVVVSNILAQPLILLAPLLAARTAPGGRIALAGVLASQAAEVSAAYAPFFDARATQAEQGWALIEGPRR